MDALKPIIESMSAAPWWVLTLAISSIVLLVGTVIWRAWKEGREISIWPPKIGPRPEVTGGSSLAPVTDISGRWNAYLKDPKDSTPVGHATIKQTGERVTMSLHRQEDREGRPASRDYRYTGRFRARQLTLLWEAVDRPDYRIGAMVFHLSEAGTQFRGLTVFYDDTFRGVGTAEYWLQREGS